MRFCTIGCTGWLLLAVLLAKVASTASTVGSGAVGGVFTPTLFIGAAIGALDRLAAPAGDAAHAVQRGGLRRGWNGRLPGRHHARAAHLRSDDLRDDARSPGGSAADSRLRDGALRRQGLSWRRIDLSGVARAGAADGSSVAWQLRTVAELIKPAAAVVGETMGVRQMLETLPPRPVQAVYIVNPDRGARRLIRPPGDFRQAGASRNRSAVRRCSKSPP